MSVRSVYRAGVLTAVLSLFAHAALRGSRVYAEVEQPAGSGQAGAQTLAEKIAASKDLLDINTATPVQLKALPGMGDAYVRRVIAGRPYTAKNQLTTRGILPSAEYEQIKGLIIAHRVK